MKNITQNLISIGLPLAIGFISQMTISFTDAAIISRLGPEQLAGATLGMSFFTIIMLFGIGFISAVSPYVAESFRKCNNDHIQLWYSQGQWISVITGLAGMLLLAFTAEILRWFGISAQLCMIAQEYNYGAAPGLIFFFLYVNVRCLFSAIGRPKPLTFIMILAIPVNILLSWAFILGLPFIKGMGVFGAGVSSSLIRALIIFCATYVLTRSKISEYISLPIIPVKIDFVSMSKLIKTGAPIGLRIAVGEGFLPVIAFFIAAYGTDATAAHSVASRVASLIGVFVLGFSGAATTLSSWYRAEQDWRGLSQLRLSSLIVSLGYVVFVGIFICIFYKDIASILFGIKEHHVLSLIGLLLPMLLFSFALDTVGGIYNGFLVGMLDTAIPTLVITLSYWVLGLGGGLMLSIFTSYGFFSYWISMILSSFFIAVFNYLRAGMHIRNLKYNQELSTLSRSAKL